MSKYSIHATKQDFQNIFEVLKQLEEQLKMILDWKKIKRVSMDELSTIVGILKRKLPAKPADSIEVTKVGIIDSDNLRLKCVIVKNGETFETYFQYIISANSAHHSDIEFENMMECFGVDMEQVRDNIENRQIRIQ